MVRRLATRSGLLHGDAVIRKQSQFLLREGLHARGFSVPTPTVLPSLPSDPLDGHDFWLDTRSRVASQLLSLPLNWELLLSLLEAMEDFPVHLVDEVWPHHARLFPVFIPSDEGIIVPPDVSHGLDHVPFVWASIALHRALNNHARRVKHKLLLQYLRLPPPCTGATTPVGLTVPFQFASTQLIAFLDDGNVFKTARHELMDCVLSYFTRYMEALDSSCRPLFLASYLHTLHSGFTCVSLVRPLMSVFTQALARSVSRSAPLPALSVTSAEDLIALVNHISLSYTDSVQRAALPCALDCLLRFSTPNDLPPLCIAKVLLSFPRHLLAASKDWIKTWFSLVRPVEFLESVRATITTAISRDSTADVSSSTQLGTLLVLATLCGDACMPILDTFVGVMVNMFVEVYMPSTLQQVLLSTLSSFVLLSHVLNPGCPFTTTAMREVDDAVSSIFQLRLHSALSISSATDSASSHPISLALCLDVASSLLQCAESVVIPRLLAACRDALSASLRQLVMPPTASTDSVRSRVSHCIQVTCVCVSFITIFHSFPCAERSCHANFCCSNGQHWQCDVTSWRRYPDVGDIGCTLPKRVDTTARRSRSCAASCE